MDGKLNGAPSAEALSESPPAAPAEMSLVRSALGSGTFTELHYSLPNGNYGGEVHFRAINPDVACAIAEDFLSFARQLRAAAQEAMKQAAQRQEAPRVQVAGADTLGKLRKPQ